MPPAGTSNTMVCRNYSTKSKRFANRPVRTGFGSSIERVRSVEVAVQIVVIITGLCLLPIHTRSCTVLDDHALRHLPATSS